MLIYTFRTAPFTEKLLETNTRLFVFGRMREDFEIFAKKIIEEKPDFIVGMAAADESRLEPIAINQFNEKKKVVQNADQYIYLHIPTNQIFPIAAKPTDSFCNWTAYRIAHFIKQNKLGTKVIFAHIHPKDMARFLDYLAELE